MKKFGALLLTLLLTSCMQMQADDDLCLVPVTNNPHIVPNHGASGIPLPN